MRCLVTCLVIFCLSGCGSDSSSGDSGSTEPKDTIDDTSVAGLVTFARGKQYQHWAKDAEEIHSGSVHGNVRIFFNPMLEESLRASNTEHPVGSVALKVLYDTDKETIKGYAIDIKTAEGTGKDTWLYWEGFAPSYDTIYGQGHVSCHGCHGSGVDYVRAAPL